MASRSRAGPTSTETSSTSSSGSARHCPSRNPRPRLRVACPGRHQPRRARGRDRATSASRRPSPRRTATASRRRPTITDVREKAPTLMPRMSAHQTRVPDKALAFGGTECEQRSVLIRKSYKFRAYPDVATATALDRGIGCTRFVYIQSLATQDGERDGVGVRGGREHGLARFRANARHLARLEAPSSRRSSKPSAS